VNISLVSPDNVDAIWPHIAKMVSDCIEKHPVDASAGDYWTGCRTGQFFLILAHDEKAVAVSIWRFETWPTGPILNNLLTASEPNRSGEWFQPMDDFVNGMAQANGVSTYKWSGPRAWGRLLPRAKITSCNYIMEVRA
jgi:hypothetical protein